VGTERDVGGRPIACPNAAAAAALAGAILGALAVAILGALAARTLLVLETAPNDAAVLDTAAKAVPEAAAIVGGKAIWR
jgi:hypothetical protein